jgi:hypothetical protein
MAKDKHRGGDPSKGSSGQHEGHEMHEGHQEMKHGDHKNRKSHEFGVTDTVTLADGTDEKELLKYAAAIEMHSEHPIAKGIAASFEKPPRVENFKSYREKAFKVRWTAEKSRS